MPSDRMHNFGEKYKALREHHRGLIELDSIAIQKVQQAIHESEVMHDTDRYITSTLSAIVFFATFPFLAVGAFSLATSWSIPLSAFLSKRELLDNHPEIFVSALLVSLAVPIYTLVAPRLSMAHPAHRKLVQNVNMRSGVYIGFALLTNYTVLVVPLMLLYSYINLPIVVDALAIVWLVAPLIVLACLPALLFLAVAVLWSLRRQERRESTREVVAARLVELVDELDNTNDLWSLRANLKQKVVASMGRISERMRRIYLGTRRDHAVSQWAASEMERAANNFMSFATWIYFPQPNTLQNLKVKLCEYLNIVLSGHYDELPRHETSEFGSFVLKKESKGWVRKTLFFFFLALYMSLPIIGLFALTAVTAIDLPAWVHSPLTVLYVVWAVLGLLFFFEDLTPEAKDLFREIVQVVIRKRPE